MRAHYRLNVILFWATVLFVAGVIAAMGYGWSQDPRPAPKPVRAWCYHSDITKSDDCIKSGKQWKA